MKSKLPILTAVVLLAAGIFFWREPRQKSLRTLLSMAGQGSGGETDPAAEPESRGGQEMVAEAAENLARWTSLQAKIRHRTDLYQQQLTGSGSYSQIRVEKIGDADREFRSRLSGSSLTAGAPLKYRLELKLPVADHVSSLQQICDGEHLWIRRELPGDESLTRVNLKQVYDALNDAPADATFDPARLWMSLGGLPKLLRGLHEYFAFAAPEQGQIGDQPVWLLSGTWQPERLANVLPEHKAAILAGRPIPPDQWPPHLPDRVELALARDDEIPLFPFRIDFRQTNAKKNRDSKAGQGGAGQGSGALPSKSVVTFELFEVQIGGPIDPQQFTFALTNQVPLDVTEEFLRGLGLR